MNCMLLYESFRIKIERVVELSCLLYLDLDYLLSIKYQLSEAHHQQLFSWTNYNTTRNWLVGGLFRRQCGQFNWSKMTLWTDISVRNVIIVKTNTVDKNIHILDGKFWPMDHIVTFSYVIQSVTVQSWRFHSPKSIIQSTLFWNPKFAYIISMTHNTKSSNSLRHNCNIVLLTSSRNYSEYQIVYIHC